MTMLAKGAETIGAWKNFLEKMRRTGDKSLDDARKKSKGLRKPHLRKFYLAFVTMAVSLSGFLLYQQMRFIRRDDSLLLDLPWKMDFEMKNFATNDENAKPREFPPFKKDRRLPLPDPILRTCDECEKAEYHKNYLCKRRIVRWLTGNITLEALHGGQRSVSEEYESCGVCRPEVCQSHVHIQYRFDEAAPTIHHAITHSLSSIPAKNRIPERVMTILPAYFKGWVESRPHILFTYNPSVVKIPARSEITMPGAAYIATFRVTPWHQCGFDTYNFKASKVNMMGIALLDSNLDILEGTDTLIDINRHKYISGRPFLNFRMFVIGRTIWLAEDDKMLPLRVRTPSYGTPQYKRRSIFGYIFSFIGLSSGKDIVAFPPRKDAIISAHSGGDVLEVSLPTSPRYMKKELRVKDGNYNLFLSDKGDVFYELFPLKPRQIYPLNAVLGAKKLRKSEEVMTELAEGPDDAFETDEYWLKRPYLLDRDRGGACCVKLGREFYQDLLLPQQKYHAIANDQRYLLMGISSRRTHRQVGLDVEKNAKKKKKKKDPNEPESHYLFFSRIYAFVPEPPFEVVAASGLFCLGFAPDEEGNVDQYAKLTKEKGVLQIREKLYECPLVQVATGITEKAGDDSRVIVSYGINDCIPRMVEWDKREMAHHMFSQLSLIPLDGVNATSI